MTLSVELSANSLELVPPEGPRRARVQSRVPTSAEIGTQTGVQTTAPAPCLNRPLGRPVLCPQVRERRHGRALCASTTSFLAAPTPEMPNQGGHEEDAVRGEELCYQAEECDDSVKCSSTLIATTESYKRPSGMAAMSGYKRVDTPRVADKRPMKFAGRNCCHRTTRFMRCS